MPEESTALAPLQTSSSDQLIAVAESAEKRLAAIQKILSVALKITNHQDWVDFGGKPYLQATGAEKIARMFGICWRFDEPTVEFLDDGHFIYTYKGYFSMGASEIEVIGTRNSADEFFSVEHGQDIPASEIDRSDVKKSAYTNCINNGITRLLGLRNLTWEQVGGKQEKSTGISFGKDPNAAMKLPNYGRHKGQQMDDPSVPVEELYYYLSGAEKSIADPEKAKYKANNEKMRDALKAEIVKREKPVEESKPADGLDKQGLDSNVPLTKQASDVPDHLQADAEIEQHDLRMEYVKRFQAVCGLAANPIHKEMMNDARLSQESKDSLYKTYLTAIKTTKVK